MENPPHSPDSSKSTGKIVGLVGCGCLALVAVVVLAIGGGLYGFMQMFKGSAPYQDSIAAVSAHPETVAALGEPIEPGFFITGSINYQNDDGEANLAIPVSGPEGSGTVHIEGTKTDGKWSYETWHLQVEGRSEPIPLGE